MRMRTCVAFALLGLLASAANAQDYGRSGPYASANLVIGVDNFEGTGALDFDTGFGVSGRFGYRLNEFIAVEGQFEYSGNFEDDDFGVDARGITYTANGKFYLMSERVQPYALVGIGAVTFDVDPGFDDSSFVAKVGGGVDFFLTDQIGFLGEVVYNVSTGDNEDARYVSLGFGAFYRF